MDIAIAELGEEFYKLSEVADILRVSTSTLRRLLKNKDLTAPSKELRYGGLYVYLYTPKDVEELRGYIDTRRKNGRWNRSRGD